MKLIGEITSESLQSRSFVMKLGSKWNPDSFRFPYNPNMDALITLLFSHPTFH